MTAKVAIFSNRSVREVRRLVTMEERVKRLEAVCVTGPSCRTNYSTFPQLVFAYLFIVAYIYLKILVNWRNNSMAAAHSALHRDSQASFIEDDFSRLTLP